MSGLVGDGPAHDGAYGSGACTCIRPWAYGEEHWQGQGRACKWMRRPHVNHGSSAQRTNAFGHRCAGLVGQLSNSEAAHAQARHSMAQSNPMQSFFAVAFAVAWGPSFPSCAAHCAAHMRTRLFGSCCVARSLFVLRQIWPALSAFQMEMHSLFAKLFRQCVVPKRLQPRRFGAVVLGRAEPLPSTNRSAAVTPAGVIA